MARFWLKWMGASAVGFAVTFVLLFVAIDILSGGEGPEAWGVPFEVAFPIVLGVATTVMATLQWLLIRRRLARSAAWVPATVLGIVAGSLVVFGLLEHDPSTLVVSLLWGLSHAFVVGGIVGALQWRAVRVYDPDRLWIRTSVLGFLVAEVVGNTVGWFTDGGLGIVLVFVLWQAFTAPRMYTLLRGVDAPIDATARSTSRPGMAVPI